MTTIDLEIKQEPFSKSPSPNENTIPYSEKTQKRKFDKVSPEPKTKIKVEQPAERWPAGYKPVNLADIPDFIGEINNRKCDFKDASVLNAVDELDKHHNIKRQFLLQNIALPFEVVLKLWSMQSFENIDDTIAICKDLVQPNYVPPSIKNFMLANMEMEKYNEFQKSKHERTGWLVVMSRTIHNVVNGKQLMEDYYGDKKKIGANWKFEQHKEKWSDVEELELHLKMKQADITFVSRSSSAINSSNSSSSSGKRSRSISVSSSTTPPK